MSNSTKTSWSRWVAFGSALGPFDIVTCGILWDVAGIVSIALGFSLGQESSAQWVSDLIAIWDGPAANSCRAWHGLSSTSWQVLTTHGQTWQAKDAYGGLWNCSSFFKLICIRYLIIYIYMCVCVYFLSIHLFIYSKLLQDSCCLFERLSAHHGWTTGASTFEGLLLDVISILHSRSNHSEGHGFSMIFVRQSSGWDRKPICSCNKLFFVVEKLPWSLTQGCLLHCC